MRRFFLALIASCLYSAAAFALEQFSSEAPA
jgi:hypothetical protein